jgi:hypothetical protein
VPRPRTWIVTVRAIRKICTSEFLSRQAPTGARLSVAAFGTPRDNAAASGLSQPPVRADDLRRARRGDKTAAEGVAPSGSIT